MNYISVRHLKALGACSEQISKFKGIFGAKVEFETKEEAVAIAVKHASDFYFSWVGYEVFGEDYEEAEAPLLKDYEEAKATLLKAYDEAVAPLWKAYKEAEVPLWEDYEEAKATLWKAYEEAKAPLLKAYKEAKAKIFAEMWFDKQ